MLWLEHLFVLCLLGHLLWAAILLQREWRRLRLRDIAGPAVTTPDVPGWSESKVTPARG
jgi:hypothetical protein